MSTTNTALWDSVCKTDPSFTKNFSRSGGFKGTAISPMYLMRRATEKFGPIGIGWGFHELEHKIVEGVWFSQVQMWYQLDGQRGLISQWGATTMVNERSSGKFVDEEAAKKSVTDAVTKCLSYLGFGADIHMGLYDDIKYVNELKAEIQAEKKQEKAEAQAQEQKPVAVQPKPAAVGPKTLGEFQAAIKRAEPVVSSELYLQILTDEGFSKGVEYISTTEDARRVYELMKLAARQAKKGAA
jgi:hypothetical protein